MTESRAIVIRYLLLICFFGAMNLWLFRLALLPFLVLILTVLVLHVGQRIWYEGFILWLSQELIEGTAHVESMVKKMTHALVDARMAVIRAQAAAVAKQQFVTAFKEGIEKARVAKQTEPLSPKELPK